MSEKLSERFAALFMRHHRDSCYPTAMPFEAEAFADEAVASLAAHLAAAAKAPPGDSDADVEAIAQQLQTATAALTAAVSPAPAPAAPASPAA